MPHIDPHPLAVGVFYDDCCSCGLPADALSTDTAVPQFLAEEIVQQYADVLRVGCVKVNGAEVCWPTSGSTRSQLKAFSEAFSGVLRKLPETKGLEDVILSHAVYWFCKVVSINYVLCQVLQLVKSKVGKECSISTSGRGGRSIVDYCVEVQSDNTMRVRLVWKEKRNIVHCDPKTARKEVRGTLSMLAVDIPMRPSPCFTPVYTLDMKVKRSYKQKMISKMTPWRNTRRCSSDNVYVDAPLQSCSSSFMEASTSYGTEAPSSFTSFSEVDSITSRDNSWDLPSPCSSLSSPLHFAVHSVSALPTDHSQSTLRETSRAPGFV
jgi:hypothetical protein